MEKDNIKDPEELTERDIEEITLDKRMEEADQAERSPDYELTDNEE